MTQAPDITLLAAGALAAAAGALTAFGQRRRLYAGWRWWMAALWLTVAGIVAAALLPSPLSVAIAVPLLMQWPLVTLIGLRRFFGRQRWWGGERSDALLLGLACAAVAAGSQLLAPEYRWLLSAVVIAAHLYPAAVLFMGPGDPEATPMHGLAAVMGIVAFLPGAFGGFTFGLALIPGTQPVDLLNARAIAAALGGILLAFVAVTLVCDRTERQLRDSRRRLRVLANMDTLTQVPNRRHFNELATLALQHDPPGSAALLLFDVDHFKLINDHLGHAAGDRALCLVSASVQEHLRGPDVAGRHGGDEFVLLLRRASANDAMRVAARIVAEVQTRAADAQLPALSLSFGVAQVGAGESLDIAMRRADLALYEAKRQGRSCAVAATGDEEQPVFGESQRLGLTGA